MSGVDDIQDEIHLSHQGNGSSAVLIYFISGNPGLVEYYRSTMITVFESLEKAQHGDLDLHVYGHSLPGFSLHDSSAFQVNNPHGLDEIIQIMHQNLAAIISKIAHAAQKNAQNPVRVILVGHSLGAYLLMEILRHWHNGQSDSTGNYDLVAGICLFPTVVHLDTSPRGVWVAPLLRLPGLVTAGSNLARLLVMLIPTMALIYFIQSVLGMPAHGARVTAAYLKSRNGIRQTLYMANQEMLHIKDDLWESKIWDPRPFTQNTALEKRTKLYFHWGRDDYWVNNVQRDKLIAVRAASSEHPMRPDMVVDSDGIPHAFCLDHSDFIAGKITSFVSQLLIQSNRASGQLGI